MSDDTTEPTGVEHDPGTGRYRLHADRDLGTAVAVALADALDVDPLELAPLHDAADPGALDDLRVAARGRTDADEWTTSFVAYGHEVTVRGGGETVTLQVDAPSA